MPASRKSSCTLRRYIVLSWIGPALLSILASLVIFVSLGWLEYENVKQRITRELEQRSVVAARRLSAEILLGAQGAIDPVRELLKQDLGVADVSIALPTQHCGKDEAETCHQTVFGNIQFFRKTPHTASVSYIVLSQPLPPLQSFLNLYLLIWSVFPVFLILVSGLALQHFVLRRFMIEPISDLVVAAERKIAIPDHWPAELQEIATRLADSFHEREQAVFAMLAKGVVHDIRTSLHSLLSAAELVAEQTDNQTKRLTRLEGLHRACSAHLPRMKRIVALTLDGSREIPIHSQRSPLLDTVANAIQSVSEQAALQQVQVKMEPMKLQLHLHHDPVQLERALTNLIKNGIEAAAIGQSPKRSVEVIITEAKDSITLTVEDTGSGFCGLSNVFQPMRSTKPQGTGLGLYITSRIVQGHEGQMRVGRSVALGGASFQISLPRSSSSGGTS